MSDWSVLSCSASYLVVCYCIVLYSLVLSRVVFYVVACYWFGVMVNCVVLCCMMVFCLAVYIVWSGTGLDLILLDWIVLSCSATCLGLDWI